MAAVRARLRNSTPMKAASNLRRREAKRSRARTKAFMMSVGGRRLEFIAHAPHRVDPAGSPTRRGQLIAEMLHMHIHGAAKPLEVVAPYIVQQLLAAEY